ncbi:two component transcriptional regulator, LuxR family [Azospirillum sp. RU38E]|jgi:DNA-binding NarL/FixJ family response regulator|nr:two component transcriptional regulator, LuxR family [Azospirillum sp. RU38E]SNS03322.1 two component transcriptional regulator, LuxR family [Azospirillum sp. RU37A]
MTPVLGLTMNILIGDDHLLFREGLCRLLQQLDEKATFVEAGTFDAVLELAKGDQEFDLILMDLQMPGFPGFSGVQEVCENQAGTPVVIVSASESQADVRAALDAGASGYIPKSSSVKIMLSALNLVFSGGIYVPPAALLGDGAGVGGSAQVASASGGGAVGNASGSPALTQRQRDVLRCLREGKSNKQIAYELGLSEGTVKIHVTAVMRSLGVRNRTQAVIASADILP